MRRKKRMERAAKMKRKEEVIETSSFIQKRMKRVLNRDSFVLLMARKKEELARQKRIRAESDAADVKKRAGRREAKIKKMEELRDRAAHAAEKAIEISRQRERDAKLRAEKDRIRRTERLREVERVRLEAERIEDIRRSKRWDRILSGNIKRKGRKKIKKSKEDKIRKRMLTLSSLDAFSFGDVKTSTSFASNISDSKERDVDAEKENAKKLLAKRKSEGKQRVWNSSLCEICVLSPATCSLPLERRKRWCDACASLKFFGIMTKSQKERQASEREKKEKKKMIKKKEKEKEKIVCQNNETKLTVEPVEPVLKLKTKKKTFKPLSGYVLRHGSVLNQNSFNLAQQKLFAIKDRLEKERIQFIGRKELERRTKVEMDEEESRKKFLLEVPVLDRADLRPDSNEVLAQAALKAAAVFDERERAIVRKQRKQVEKVKADEKQRLAMIESTAKARQDMAFVHSYEWDCMAREFDKAQIMNRKLYESRFEQLQSTMKNLEMKKKVSSDSMMIKEAEERIAAKKWAKRINGLMQHRLLLADESGEASVEYKGKYFVPGADFQRSARLKALTLIPREERWKLWPERSRGYRTMKKRKEEEKKEMEKAAFEREQNRIKKMKRDEMLRVEMENHNRIRQKCWEEKIQREMEEESFQKMNAHITALKYRKKQEAKSRAEAERFRKDQQLGDYLARPKRKIL
eukprot:g1681.t1